jgi:hypothetical protein
MPRSIKRYELEQSPFYSDTLKSNKKAKLKPLEYNSKEDIYLTRKIIHKSEVYVKLIIPDNINLTAYHRLSKLSTTLLYYIITSKLNYNSPTFVLKAKEFADIMAFKQVNKVYDAINELCEEKHIARTDSREVYWINHNRYYKGSYITINEIIQK